MLDIPIAWSSATNYGDWLVGTAAPELITDEAGGSILDSAGLVLTDGFAVAADDLVVGNDLGNAILLSLFTDRSADPDDAVPDGSGDPRGWWGDLDQDVPIGSKLWLRARSKQTALTLALVKADIETALQWLLDDGIAAGLEVMTEWTRSGMLGSSVAVTGSDGATARFGWAWKEIR